MLHFGRISTYTIYIYLSLQIDLIGNVTALWPPLSVCRLVDSSVCHNFLEGRATLSYYYRSTYYLMLISQIFLLPSPPATTRGLAQDISQERLLLMAGHQTWRQGPLQVSTENYLRSFDLTVGHPRQVSSKTLPCSWLIIRPDCKVDYRSVGILSKPYESLDLRKV